MSRNTCVIGAFCLVLLLAMPAFSLPQQSVTADKPLGKTVTLSINSTSVADAYQVSDEALVPLYTTIPLGLEPHINAATGVIILQKPGLVFRLKMGSRSAVCNGKPFALSAAPRLGTTNPDTPDSKADTDARLPPIPFVPILALARRLYLNIRFNPKAGDVGPLYNLYSNQSSRLRPAPTTLPAFLSHIVPPDTRRVNNLTIKADLNYGNPGAFDPAKRNTLDTTGLALVFFNHGNTPITVSDRYIFIELANGDFNTADQTETLHGNPYRTLRVLPKTQRLLNISPFSGRRPVKRILYMDGWNFCEWKTEPASPTPAAAKSKVVSRATLWKFYQALEKDDVAGVRKGLQRGISINTLLPGFKQTPLMVAANSASLKAFNFLLARHADTHLEMRNGYSGGGMPLYYVLCGDRYRTQQDFIKEEPRRIAMLQALIAQGLELNERIHDGETHLMALALNNIQSPGLLRFLIRNGADINARNDSGQSALHTAVERGYVNMTRLLLDAGADPNIRNNTPDIKDNTAITPLFYAANTLRFDYSLLLLLLNRGAAVNTRDDSGRTPLIYLLQDACIRYFPSHRDNENDEKPPTFTPPRDDCLRLLLRRGANINAQDKQGKTALDWAKATLAECETDEHRKQAQHVIDLLLAAGANR